VVQRTGRGWQRIAGIGDGQSPASQLADHERKFADRALTSADLASEVVSDRGTHLLIAVKVDGATATVALRESPIQPTRPVPTSATSPYRDLDVALYASATAEPSSLLLISGRQPGSGSTRRTVPIGSDTWLVVTPAHGALVGSFAANFAWTITTVGVLLAIVIAALVDVLTRRRAYAYMLVQQRTSTLRQAQAAAEEANLAKSEFLSRMSHELRTPLNAVLGFSQVLELDELTPDQRESVTQISKGGRHLLNLINEVLDISHIESGKLSFSPEAVLVSELISETVDLMRPLARDRAVHLLGAQMHHCQKYIFTDRQRVNELVHERDPG
jgi:signal transduction histidine kinase